MSSAASPAPETAAEAPPSWRADPLSRRKSIRPPSRTQSDAADEAHGQPSSTSSGSSSSNRRNGGSLTPSRIPTSPSRRALPKPKHASDDATAGAGEQHNQHQDDTLAPPAIPVEQLFKAPALPASAIASKGRRSMAPPPLPASFGKPLAGAPASVTERGPRKSMLPPPTTPLHTQSPLLSALSARAASSSSSSTSSSASARKPLASTPVPAARSQTKPPALPAAPASKQPAQPAASSARLSKLSPNSRAVQSKLKPSSTATAKSASPQRPSFLRRPTDIKASTERGAASGSTTAAARGQQAKPKPVRLSMVPSASGQHFDIRRAPSRAGSTASSIAGSDAGKAASLSDVEDAPVQRRPGRSSLSQLDGNRLAAQKPRLSTVEPRKPPLAPTATATATAGAQQTRTLSSSEQELMQNLIAMAGKAGMSLAALQQLMSEGDDRSSSPLPRLSSSFANEPRLVSDSWMTVDAEADGAGDGDSLASMPSLPSLGGTDDDSGRSRLLFSASPAGDRSQLVDVDADEAADDSLAKMMRGVDDSADMSLRRPAKMPPASVHMSPGAKRAELMGDLSLISHRGDDGEEMQSLRERLEASEAERTALAAQLEQARSQATAIEGELKQTRDQQAVNNQQHEQVMAALHDEQEHLQKRLQEVLAPTAAAQLAQRRRQAVEAALIRWQNVLRAAEAERDQVAEKADMCLFLEAQCTLWTSALA